MDILRISGEPYTYFTEMEIHAMLTRSPLDYYNFVNTSLIRLAQGLATMEMPAKLLFSDIHGGGDFRVMPCVVRDGDRTTKSVKLVGTNVRQQQVKSQITVGKSFLIDNNENFISHIFEACLLSSARTSLCACIAMDRLGPGAKKLTVIGAGRVGYYCAYYAIALGLVNEVIINDTDMVRANMTVTVLRQKFPSNRFHAAPYKDLGDTDILVLATTSTTVIYHPDHFSAGLVISVGADIDYQHELSPDLVPGARVYVDTLDSTRYGDLKGWIENRLIDIKAVNDIFVLLRQEPDPGLHTRNIFISTGMALFDNLTMAYLIHG